MTTQSTTEYWLNNNDNLKQKNMSYILHKFTLNEVDYLESKFPLIIEDRELAERSYGRYSFIGINESKREKIIREIDEQLNYLLKLD